MSMFGTLGNIGLLYEGKAVFVYYLDNDARVSVIISDDQGRVVYRETGTKLAGRNEMHWNGHNNVGQQMPNGAYRITVKAVDDEGHAVAAKTYSAGKVKHFGEQGAGLSFGKITVPLNRVLAMREPTI